MSWRPEHGFNHVSPHSNGGFGTDRVMWRLRRGICSCQVNGAFNVLMVVAEKLSTTIMADDKIRPQHTPAFIAIAQAVFRNKGRSSPSSFADDKSNTHTSSVTLSFTWRPGRIYPPHGFTALIMGKIEYIATDLQIGPFPGRQNKLTMVRSLSFSSPARRAPLQARSDSMDCIDLSNRAAHSFDTPESSPDKDMALGSPSASCHLFIRKVFPFCERNTNRSRGAEAHLHRARDFLSLAVSGDWDSQSSKSMRRQRF